MSFFFIWERGRVNMFLLSNMEEYQSKNQVAISGIMIILKFFDSKFAPVDGTEECC